MAQDGYGTEFRKQFEDLTTVERVAEPALKGRKVYDTDLERVFIGDGTSWNRLANYAEIESLDPKEVQDFTAIGIVGDSAQQMAGHIFDLEEPNSPESEIEALYLFKDGVDLDNDESTNNYDLTNNGGIATASGIFSTDNDSNAVEFDGSTQYYTQDTLLDVTPTDITIDLWFKADDGNPAAVQYLFEKQNIAASDTIALSINTNGTLRFATEQANAGVQNLDSTVAIENGATVWHHCVVCWDTSYGKRIFLNGALVASDTTETTLMASGTGTNFSLGATTASTSLFDGKICMFRVRDKISTQMDIDLAYSTRYTLPVGSVNDDFRVSIFAEEDGDSDFTSQLTWGGMEVTRNMSLGSDGYLYRYGDLFNALDKIKIIVIGV